MKIGNSQRGRSLILTIIIVGLFGYTIFIGIKLAPEYMQFFSIKSSIDSLAQEMGSREMNKAQYKDFDSWSARNREYKSHRVPDEKS